VPLWPCPPAAWTPSDASVAAKDFQDLSFGERVWDGSERALLLEVLHVFVLGAAAQTESLALVLEGGGIVLGPASVARGVLEHAAYAVWLLEPSKCYQKRIARALLVAEAGIEQDVRARDEPLARRFKALQDIQSKASAWFGEQAVVEQSPAHRTSGERLLGENGTPSRLPRLMSVAGEKMLQPSKCAVEFARQVGTPVSPYAWLSSRTHPCVSTLLRSRVQDGSGVAHLSTSRESLNLTVWVAAHALCTAVTAVTRWLGSEVDVGEEWEQDIEGVVPGHFKPEWDRLPPSAPRAC